MEDRNIFMEDWHEEDSLVCTRDLEILKKARDTYGFNNQILVAVEELNELACVLTKYPRFDTPEEALAALFEKALDEVADVLVILEHVKAIFAMRDGQIRERAYNKIRRLERWMDNDPRFQHTMEDRSVPEYGPSSAKGKCSTCRWLNNEFACQDCIGGNGFEEKPEEAVPDWDKAECVKCRDYGDKLSCNWCVNGDGFHPVISLNSTPQDIEKALENSCVGCDLVSGECRENCPKVQFLNNELDRAMSRL